ncbi:hypothetical protein [Spirillospora sp. CA-294931]|uniref:hypothetical protein n=1 Tax=Spirillospora sp. CA-294931 TaxID=3240042 RepID=UPI003D90D5A8
MNVFTSRNELPMLPPRETGRSREVHVPVLDLQGGYPLVITPARRWDITIHDPATGHEVDSRIGLRSWSAVEVAIDMLVGRAEALAAGICQFDLFELCTQPVLPGRSYCIEHDHALSHLDSGWSAGHRRVTVVCRCGERFTSETRAEAQRAQVEHALALVPQLGKR